MSKKIKLFLVFAFVSAFCFAETDGEKAFKENRPGDAVVLLENELISGTISPAGYNFLGLSYFQLGDYEKSVEAFTKGIAASGTNKKLLAYNQGNSYYGLKDYDNAVKSFSLALTADPAFYNALLNRANSYLMGDKLTEALNDYKRYIILVPQDLQKESIENLITALEAEIENRRVQAELAAKEAERLLEEEKRMKEEMAKREAEERERIAREEAERRRIEEEERAREAERRRKLLEEVANSLQNTDSTNMTAGAEDLIDYDQESELD